MWRPVVPLPVTPLPPALADATPQFRGYALGWIVQDYRGHKIVQHAGGTQGFRAIVVLIPEKNVGFAIANNSEDNEFVPGILYELLDHYLGLPKHDWPKAFKDLFDARNAAGLEAQRKAVAERPKSSPSLPLAGYAGDYADPWYGPIAITEKDGALTIDFRQTPGMVAPLEHWAYDTFVARWPDPLIEPAFVTFALDAAGKPRAHHDEGLFARRGLQLRLPRPRVHASRGATARRPLKIKKARRIAPGPCSRSPLRLLRRQDCPGLFRRAGLFACAQAVLGDIERDRLALLESVNFVFLP